MKVFSKGFTSVFTSLFKSLLLAVLTCVSTIGYGDNQTNTLTPILPEDSSIPFSIRIVQDRLRLPNGVHSGVVGVHDEKWLLLAGRTNGLHGFNNDIHNFPPQQQNQVVYVVDRKKGKVYSRSLTNPPSGLTQAQIDSLSVTSPQYYQRGNTLYMTGGYGVDSLTGLFSTKSFLTAIDVSGLIDWVSKPHHKKSAADHIRQIENPIFQVTGGYMAQLKNNPTLLVFGQNFQGYYFDSTNGAYTQQVRRFHIHDDGHALHIKILRSRPKNPDPNYRRRDLNVVPVVRDKDGKLTQSLIAYSGVFTTTDGIWTVPVVIGPNGRTSMSNPAKPTTFKQGMNNYICASLGLFSQKHKKMYSLFCGGISFGFFNNGQFQTDSEIPFINQVTTIKRDSHGHYSQYLMNGTYPVILSTQSNPGNQLLFGAGAFFIPVDGIEMYDNGVIKLDALFHGKKSKLVGYIVGGIQSTLPNTNTTSDSAASPYIFKVFLDRK